MSKVYRVYLYPKLERDLILSDSDGKWTLIEGISSITNDGVDIYNSLVKGITTGAVTLSGNIFTVKMATFVCLLGEQGFFNRGLK